MNNTNDYTEYLDGLKYVLETSKYIIYPGISKDKLKKYKKRLKKLIDKIENNDIDDIM